MCVQVKLHASVNVSASKTALHQRFITYHIYVAVTFRRGKFDQLTLSEHLTNDSLDVAFSRHTVATLTLLPPHRSASNIGYTSK